MSSSEEEDKDEKQELEDRLRSNVMTRRESLANGGLTAED